MTKPNRVVVAVSPELHARLKRVSKERGMLMGRIVEDCVTPYLDKLESDNPKPESTERAAK